MSEQEKKHMGFHLSPCLCPAYQSSWAELQECQSPRTESCFLLVVSVGKTKWKHSHFWFRNVIGLILTQNSCKQLSHQSVLADNEQTLGTINLGQANLFVESAVAPHHHGDTVWEAALWDLRGWAQDRCSQVVDLETWLWNKKFGKALSEVSKYSN